jgi:hypothetical protein
MAFGTATGGRGRYKFHDASALFMSGIMQLKDMQDHTFAAWCAIPVQVRSFHIFCSL